MNQKLIKTHPMTVTFILLGFMFLFTQFNRYEVAQALGVAYFIYIGSLVGVEVVNRKREKEWDKEILHNLKMEYKGEA